MPWAGCSWIERHRPICTITVQIALEFSANLGFSLSCFELRLPDFRDGRRPSSPIQLRACSHRTRVAAHSGRKRAKWHCSRPQPAILVRVCTGLWLDGHEERTMPSRRRHKHSPAPRYWPWVLVGLWLLACVLGPRQLHAMPSLAGLMADEDRTRLGPAPTPSCVICR